MHEHTGHQIPMPDPVSLFNHHFAGALVILLGIFGYLEHPSSLSVAGSSFCGPSRY
jgi:hypothetical protein